MKQNIEIYDVETYNEALKRVKKAQEKFSTYSHTLTYHF